MTAKHSANAQPPQPDAKFEILPSVAGEPFIEQPCLQQRRPLHRGVCRVEEGRRTCQSRRGAVTSSLYVRHKHNRSTGEHPWTMGAIGIQVLGKEIPSNEDIAVHKRHQPAKGMTDPLVSGNGAPQVAGSCTVRTGPANSRSTAAV